MLNSTAFVDAQTFYTIGVTLVAVGFLIIIVTAILLILLGLKANNEGETKYGGVIVVGPFPIVFGTDKETVKIFLKLSLVLTASLTILLITFYFLNK